MTASAQDDRHDIYGGRNPAETPAYTIHDAAHWLPVVGERNWIVLRRGDG